MKKRKPKKHVQPKSPPPPKTTLLDLKQILAGTYKSATDKNGARGTTVTVKNLLVLDVHGPEQDGDYHITVQDQAGNKLIAERTLKRPIPLPSKNTIINLTGVVYCDRNHQTETWHFNTCWELHPVLAWNLA